MHEGITLEPFFLSLNLRFFIFKCYWNYHVKIAFSHLTCVLQKIFYRKISIFFLKEYTYTCFALLFLYHFTTGKSIQIYSFLSYLLEVDEFGFVCIQEKASTVVAHRVAANARLSVFKLLLHILYRSLTVQAQEGPAHQLRVNRMSTDNLATEAHKWANLHHGQLTDPAGAQNRGTLVKEAFVQNNKKLIYHFVRYTIFSF